MTYTCIPVSGGYALTEWIEKPVAPSNYDGKWMGIEAEESLWKQKLVSQPSIPTLPGHHEHWKSKLYQVVEEGDVYIEAVLETAKHLGINTPYQQGATNALTNIQEYLNFLLLTEAEHTKQVDTGFAEWVVKYRWALKQIDPCIWVRNGFDEKPKTTSELFDEYILTLQNKKG